VIGEGVQDGPLYDRLRELGCDAAQGYFATKPLDARELSAWLDARDETTALIARESAAAKGGAPAA